MFSNNNCAPPKAWVWWHNSNISKGSDLSSFVEIASNIFTISTNEDKFEPLQTSFENLEKVQPEEEDDIIKVDLGNGTFGKMSVANLNQTGAWKWKYFY